MKDYLPVALDVIGFVLVIIAAFSVNVSVGWATAGLAFIAAGWRAQT